MLKKITDYKDKSGEFNLLKDLRYEEDTEIDDPYNVILYQFFGDVIFDIFEFLTSEEYVTYYEAIFALMKAEYTGKYPEITHPGKSRYNRSRLAR